MKCGNCKGDHPSVADVRACYEHAGKVRSVILCPTCRTALEHEGQDHSCGTAVHPGQREVRKYGPGSPPPFPAGRYAVEINDVLKFLKVDIPTEGRWKGFTFVKVQASDDLYPVKGALRELALDAIAEDPREAMLRYGREIGRCGHCGRTLTDAESRAYGIGPICRQKVSFVALERDARIR